MGGKDHPVSGSGYFGTQEAKYHQLVELTDSLPGYKWVGAGRDDGKQGGEHSAIFYKAGRFKLLKDGQFLDVDHYR
jgi:hypothetical protein